jgi:hypothetical protein
MLNIGLIVDVSKVLKIPWFHRPLWFTASVISNIRTKLELKNHWVVIMVLFKQAIGLG